MTREGCHFVAEGERARVEEVLFPGGAFNVAMLGRDAVTIAKACGLTVARNTRVLVVPLERIERIGDDYPLSREKLCPVLGYYEVETAEAGLSACRAMVRRHGAGHSAAIYASDPQLILRFGAELNVLRIVVNAPCSIGAAGFQTHLAPTMTVGTGFSGSRSPTTRTPASTSATSRACLWRAGLRRPVPRPARCSPASSKTAI
jgi:hypothetical protein